MRIARKIILYTVTAIVVVIGGLGLSIYFFKDRIIQRFISEANKSLGTPIKIGSIDVSAFQDFPNLAIVLRNVYVEDSHPGEYPLLTARKISFVLNPLEVYRGRYTIRGLQLLESETNLIIDKEGLDNYTIIKSGRGSGGVSFDLQNVKLNKTLVSYVDIAGTLHHEFSSEALVATIVAKGDKYHIVAKGDLVTEQIGISGSLYFQKKEFDVTASLEYDDSLRSIAIAPSTLQLESASFEVSGSYTWKDKNLIDLKASGKETNIGTLLSFFPVKSTTSLMKYQSEGNVYFDLGLRGEISPRSSPVLDVRFGLDKATIFHPDLKAKIEEAYFKGTFSSPQLSRWNKAALTLEDVSGKLNGAPFTGNLDIENLEDPFVVADFHGELSADDLLALFPRQDVFEVSGKLKADISLNGQINLLKDKTTAQLVRTQGTVTLTNLDFLAGKGKHHFANLNGTLQFNNNDVAMSELAGKFENTDFLLNGFFKNAVTFLLFEDQPIGIEADLKSQYVDADQLFAIGLAGETPGFNISPQLHLKFNCDVKRLRYRKFHPTEIRGDLLVKNQLAVSRSIKLRAMGGAITLSGIVDARNPKAIDLSSSASFDGIHVDSVFYVFENFQQDFIGYEHLKGQAVADISMEGTLHEDLHLYPETLVADVHATIRNGELNDFQPLQKLNKYLDDEGLSKLRFADLSNDIHIENRTVYIPQMDIRTNVTTLQLSGTHTFDQKIDYRVVAPLRNKKKIDPEEAFGAIEDDLKGRSKVYFRITGTTDQYEVKYDKEAVRKKISGDIKKEVLELKEALKLKGKKKKEVELDKDEVFDW